MSAPILLAAPAAAPAVTISVLLLLLLVAGMLCHLTEHRWSTLVLGVLIGLYLTGDFADGVKGAVSQTVIAIASGLSGSLG
ncbi:hypothetical protein [Streptomyces cylindrosporus]|uniref:Uncharacterized protein n=1 Tax=Streptomyces cylindrosporus TaxID=2927583 RepID=A0ABS9YG77_9ACTN|nr:hypothetical protein [Streptomyces cylindrosporus]MCI3276252.1 hypothetical protein [Streptomyces cylindrosporus]